MKICFRYQAKFFSSLEVKKLPKTHYNYLFKNSNEERQVTHSMNICTQEASGQEANGTKEPQWPPCGSQSSQTRSYLRTNFLHLELFWPVYIPNSFPHLFRSLVKSLPIAAFPHHSNLTPPILFFFWQVLNYWIKKHNNNNTMYLSLHKCFTKIISFDPETLLHKNHCTHWTDLETEAQGSCIFTVR